jgi:hypothetical protein
MLVCMCCAYTFFYVCVCVCVSHELTALPSFLFLCVFAARVHVQQEFEFLAKKKWKHVDRDCDMMLR